MSSSLSPSAPFFDAVTSRRSMYHISDQSPIPDSKIVQIVQDAVKHAPSAFNSQNIRAVVLFGEHHHKLWDFAIEAAPKRSPADNGQANIAKMKNSFNAGHGTVLFFEDQDVIAAMQKRAPAYEHHFPQWSGHASGMVQFIVWTALEQEGLGASLQHWNPLIDEQVKKEFNVPASWELVAQMPFGKLVTPPGEKAFQPIEERVRVLGGDL